MKLKYYSFFSFLFFLSLSGIAQNHWSSHDINVSAKDIYIESPKKIWVTHNSELCVFNTLSNQFDTCYNSITSNLIGTPGKLIYANNRIWMTTSAGLSSFDGSVFTNYNGTNGLLSNAISDIAVDTSGQLWLGSASGVSYFNGTNFIHDNSIPVRQLAIDDSNRVFVLEKTNVANHPSFGNIYVKVDTGWQQNMITGIAPLTQGGPVINNYTLKKAGSKIVILSNSYDGGYYELSYPARIDSIKLDFNDFNRNGGATFIINDIVTDLAGKKWAMSQTANAFIYSSSDSLLEPHYLDDYRSPDNNQKIKVKDSLIVVYLYNKLFSTSILAEPNSNIIEEISINSIRTSANAIGPLFNDFINGQANFEMPKGNNSHGIYSANFLVSSKRQGDPVFKMNQRSVYQQTLELGAVNDFDGIGGVWITKVSLQQIQNHISNFAQPGYIVPDNIANWKGNGDVSAGMASQLAEFVDLNSNQIYEPALGDYPVIKGDEAIYWINHRNKLEYHGMLYGFDMPSDSALNQSLFLEYKVINRDVVGYDSIKMGMSFDFDLGNFNDDYIGCDSINNIFYAYNGDAFDESVNGNNGFGSNIPFIGVKFLSDSMDGFLTYNGSGSLINGEPSLDSQWHNYLNSNWQNGSPILFGGDGYQNTSTIPTKYMYTSAGSGWSEDTPGFGLPANAPGDRRSLAHIPYFSLQPGQTKTVSMSVGYGLKANGGRLGSLTTLIKVLDSAGVFWNDSLLTSISKNEIILDGLSMMMYPNPTEGQVYIQVSGIDERASNQLIDIYSLQGKLVKQYKLKQEVQVLNLSDLEKGIYFVRVGNAVKKLVVQ